jgi:hypothetical protein
MGGAIRDVREPLARLQNLEAVSVFVVDVIVLREDEIRTLIRQLNEHNFPNLLVFVPSL